MAREGDKNGRAILDWPRILELRRQYRENRNGRFNRQGNGNHSAYSTAAIAAREGVSQSTMWSALTEKSWRKR